MTSCPCKGNSGQCHAQLDPAPYHRVIQTAQYPVGVSSSTRTRYAKAGDADIAYQVLGDGPIDLLLGTGYTIPIDCMDEEPSMARFQRRLASLGRLIRFDLRGVGLSERRLPSEPPGPLTLGDAFRDCAVAVLDEVGSERAALLTPWIASPGGISLTAKHPERVSHLVLVNGFASSGLGTRLPRWP